MIKKKFVLTSICFCIIFLTGCAALDLREANHELADLYRLKIEALNSNQWVQEVTVNEALSVLADRAAEECNDRTNSSIN